MWRDINHSDAIHFSTSVILFILQFYDAANKVVLDAINKYRIDGDLTNLIDFTQREVSHHDTQYTQTCFIPNCLQ